MATNTAKSQVNWKRFRQLRWRTVTILAALMLVALISSYGVWVYSGARSVEKLLDSAEELDLELLTANNKEALQSASTFIQQSDGATRDLSGKLRPVRVAANSLGWLPWIGDQLRAPHQLTARATADLAGANLLIMAAIDLSRAQAIFNSDGGSSQTDSSELDALSDSLKAHAEVAGAQLAAIREAAAEMDGASLLWFLRSRATRVSDLERRLLDGGQVLITAPGALESALSVRVSAAALLDSLGSNQRSMDLDNLALSLDQIAGSSEAASLTINKFSEAVSRFGPSSQLASLAADLSVGIDGVAQMSTGLNTISQNVNAAFDTLSGSSGSILENGDVLLMVLGQLAAEREALDDAVGQAKSGLQTIRDLVKTGHAVYLPEGFEDALFGPTAALIDAGRILVDGPGLFIDLLGRESTKTYLILGQSSDELRAAGGFTSSAWTLTFADGALSSNVFIPILEFDRLSTSGPEVRLAPESLQYYMDAGALYLRDVGWEADFAGVGRTASSLYRSNQKGEVDGVIAVNQWGIIRLVEAVGGVELAGVSIDPEDTLRLIENRTDAEGTQFLQTVFTALLNSLRGDMDRNTLLELMLSFNEMLNRKELMLFSNSEEDQRRIESFEWGGRIPVDTRDRLAVIDSNVGWSKSDRSINRHSEYKVDLSSLGNPIANLVLKYVHTGEETGRDCDFHSPPSVQYSPYDVSINSCYWNYMRAFVAVGAELLTAPDLPLPVNSVPDRLERQEPGTSTFTQEFDEYGTHFAGLTATPPGDLSEFSIEYSLPSSVVHRSEASVTYELVLVAQPGVRSRSVSVEIKLPRGHSIASSSHSPVDVSAGAVRFEFDLATDQVLTLVTANDQSL